MENDCRTVHKDHAHHHEQQHGEHKVYLLCAIAKILAHKLGQTNAAVAKGEHAAHIVVHSSCKDAAEHNPQISHRTIPCTHDGAEDGACASDVKKLDHKYFPAWQHHIVDAVGF